MARRLHRGHPSVPPQRERQGTGPWIAYPVALQRDLCSACPTIKSKGKAFKQCYPRRILGKSKIRILIPRVEMALSTLRVQTRCCMLHGRRGSEFSFAPLGAASRDCKRTLRATSVMVLLAASRSDSAKAPSSPATAQRRVAEAAVVELVGEGGGGGGGGGGRRRDEEEEEEGAEGGGRRRRRRGRRCVSTETVGWTAPISFWESWSFWSTVPSRRRDCHFDDTPVYPC